jgi:hypothetical protein
MTLDEIRFYFSNQHEQIWLSEEENPQTIAPHMIRSPKTMLTVVCDPSEFHLVNALFRGEGSRVWVNIMLTISSSKYVFFMMKKIKEDWLSTLIMPGDKVEK